MAHSRFQPILRPGCSHSGNTLGITGRDRVDEIIARVDAVGEGWRKPYLRAARDGLLALLLSSNGQRVDKRLLADRRRPQLLIVTDDHPAAIGPDGWPQIRKLMTWAKLVIIHASGGEDRWSHMAVAATLQAGRVLMVECEFRQHDAWLSLVRAHGCRHLSILPMGGVHPIAGPPEGVVVQ